jgi:hypothetical protein
MYHLCRQFRPLHERWRTKVLCQIAAGKWTIWIANNPRRSPKHIHSTCLDRSSSHITLSEPSRMRPTMSLTAWSTSCIWTDQRRRLLLRQWCAIRAAWPPCHFVHQSAFRSKETYCGRWEATRCCPILDNQTHKNNQRRGSNCHNNSIMFDQ